MAMAERKAARTAGSSNRKLMQITSTIPGMKSIKHLENIAPAASGLGKDAEQYYSDILATTLSGYFPTDMEGAVGVLVETGSMCELVYGDVRRRILDQEELLLKDAADSLTAGQRVRAANYSAVLTPEDSAVSACPASTLPTSAEEMRHMLRWRIDNGYIEQLKQRKQDWVHRSMELIYTYAKQYRYARLADMPFLPLDLPADPSRRDFEEVLAGMKELDLNWKALMGHAGTEATVAYTVYRADQAPIFQQLEQTGHAVVTVPMPEASRFYNVRMQEVQLYLKPIVSESDTSFVQIQLVKGTQSSFFDQEGKRSDFTHPHPAMYIFKYFRESCEAISSAVKDDGEDFISYSPYGTWNITVADPSRDKLASVQQLRFVFRVQFQETPGFSAKPMFGHDLDNPNGVEFVASGKEGGEQCGAAETVAMAARTFKVNYPVASLNRLVSVSALQVRQPDASDPNLRPRLDNVAPSVFI